MRTRQAVNVLSWMSLRWAVDDVMSGTAVMLDVLFVPRRDDLRKITRAAVGRGERVSLWLCADSLPCASG